MRLTAGRWSPFVKQELAGPMWLTNGRVQKNP